MDMLKSILFFDSLITPKVITFLYWAVLVMMMLGGLLSIFTGQILLGLGLMIGLPIVYRVMFETIIVAFKNNEYLKKIAEKE